VFVVCGAGRVVVVPHTWEGISLGSTSIASRGEKGLFAWGGGIWGDLGMELFLWGLEFGGDIWEEEVLFMSSL
jgi:hypothetical protein